MGFFSKIGDFIGGAAGDIAGSLVSGGLSFLGQSSANDTNLQQAEQTSAFNAVEAEKQRQFNAQEARTSRRFNASQAGVARKWSERLSSTAHQREIQDLRRAGLNPILSSRYGGSSSPTGPTASGPAASGGAASGVAGRVENALGPAVNSAQGAIQRANEVRMNRAQVANLAAQTRQTDAATRKTQLEGDAVEFSIDKTAAETGLIMGQKRNVAQTLNLLREQTQNAAMDGRIKEGEAIRLKALIDKAEAEARSAKVQAEIDEAIGEVAAYLKVVMPWASSAIDVYRSSKSNKRKNIKDTDKRGRIKTEGQRSE